MITLQSLPSLIARNPQGYAVFLSKFLELSHDAVCYNGYAFGIQAVHHGGEEFELLLDSVREEIGIDEDGVGRDKGGVVLEEQR